MTQNVYNVQVLFLLNSSVVGSHSTACMYEATRLFYKINWIFKKGRRTKRKKKIN